MEAKSTRVLLILRTLSILACFTIQNYAVQSDIDCLRSIKESLEDPKNRLSSWDFSNDTDGSICRFSGVECWHPDESKVLNIRLSEFRLRGSFPIGIQDCTSLIGLDLSRNYLTGQIPSNIADIIPFVTTLDLSNNNLSGPIPPDIGKLSFINVLRLDNNQLTGQIPANLSELDRLREFSVANNRLSGKVPVLPFYFMSPEIYENNPGLCGAPLSPCVDDLFFSGFAVGLPVFIVTTVLFIFFCLPRMSKTSMRSYLSKIKKRNERKHHLVSRIFQIVFTGTDIIEESKVKSSVSHR